MLEDKTISRKEIIKIEVDRRIFASDNPEDWTIIFPKLYSSKFYFSYPGVNTFDRVPDNIRYISFSENPEFIMQNSGFFTIRCLRFGHFCKSR